MNVKEYVKNFENDVKLKGDRLPTFLEGTK